jgi:hypothetical protein
VLDWRHFQTNHSPNLHSKQVCLHHQHEMQYSCCMTISIRGLWFANSTTKIMKQDWSLRIAKFLGCNAEEIDILFSGEDWFYLIGHLNSQNNRFLMLIDKVSLLVGRMVYDVIWVQLGLWGTQNSRHYVTYILMPFSEHLLDYERTCAFFQFNTATGHAANSKAAFSRGVNHARESHFRGPLPVWTRSRGPCVWRQQSTILSWQDQTMFDFQSWYWRSW